MVGALHLLAYGTGQCADKTFLGLVPWYHYLHVTYNTATKGCDVQFNTVLGSHSGLLLVLLAVIDDLLRIAGVIAVIFVLYAGIRYITSQGSPDETSKAQSTLINALIGLTLAVVAVALVSFVGSHIGTGSASGSSSGLDVSSLPTAGGASGGALIQKLLTITFGIIGALSLLFVTIGGLRYVLSHGDPNSTERAKQTIMYALIGLLISVAAEGIVAFVLGHLV